MRKLHKLILVFTLLITISAYGQYQAPKIGMLTGTILDSVSKKPLDYVSVKLFSSKDSTLKGGVYTNAEGKINLDEIALGSYYLKITFAGYNTKMIQQVTFTNEKPIRDIGVIALSTNKILALDEVVVKGKQESIVNNIDKKIYNVGDDIAVKGGTANDILNNVPSVQIDQDGKISLRGDGNVTILIDGRPSSLSGGNGKSLLDALPANSIERIEIVTNPSSKYDPDGTSGIINIVLKKNKLKGINGNINLNAGTGNAYNATAGLSIRNAKMNLYGTYSYKYYEGFRNYESYLDRTLGTSHFILDQNREGTDLMINNTARIGSDFYLNDRNIIGVSATVNTGTRERTGDLQNLQFDEALTTIRDWKRLSSDPSKSLSADFNLNYKKDFKQEKGNVIFDVNQSIGSEATQGYYEESYLLNYGVIDPTIDLYQRLDNKDKFNVTTIQADVIRILPKTFRLETGAKAILRNSLANTFSETYDQVVASYLEDTVANFDYEYKEQIYSTYANLGNQYKKLKYQVGVRLEHAVQAPNLISENQSFKKEYNNIFPTGFLKYELSKISELSLSYSRRINRPTSENLNPFTSYADPYNLRRGNPDLNPEYINSFDLGYSLNTKKINVTLSTFYRRTNSVISRVRTFSQEGASTLTYANVDNSESFGPEIIVVYKPFPWFKNVISANGNSIRFIDDTPGLDLNNSGFFWSMKYAGTFDLWKKTATFQINGQYSAPRITPQGKVQPRASMDLSFDKTLKNSKWAVGCRLTDVFNTQEFRIHVDQVDVQQTARFKQNTRRFYLNLSYKFGKYEIKKMKSTGDGGGGMDF